MESEKPQKSRIREHLVSCRDESSKCPNTKKDRERREHYRRLPFRSCMSLLKTGAYTVKVDLVFTCFFAVILKALPPVCMKYTARGESRVANIARGEAECYICHETLTKSCILSYKRSGSALSVLLYFTLKICVNRGHSFEI